MLFNQLGAENPPWPFLSSEKFLKNKIVFCTYNHNISNNIILNTPLVVAGYITLFIDTTNILLLHNDNIGSSLNFRILLPPFARRYSTSIILYYTYRPFLIFIYIYFAILIYHTVYFGIILTRYTSCRNV